MQRVVLDAPAKLNLHLGIYGELDERRYHRADSVMVAVDVCDTVEVGLRGCGGPHVACEPPVDVAAEKNTAYRAAIELAGRVGRPADVSVLVRKRVPAQAGMGGSSSDAAAVLRALCLLWDIEPSDTRVVEAARAVGADVPFFLDPVPTLLVGAGDVVAQRFAARFEPVPVVLVRPAGAGVSTPVAYAEFDREHEEPGDSRALCELLESGHVTAASLAPLLSNNLDPVACRLLPAVGEVRDWLLAQDEVLGGQVTGSGSCVFGLCRGEGDARRAAERARLRFGGWARAAHVLCGSSVACGSLAACDSAAAC